MNLYYEQLKTRLKELDKERSEIIREMVQMEIDGNYDYDNGKENK